MNMTAEEAIKWTRQGWIVGCNREGTTAWMQWVHGVTSTGKSRFTQPAAPITENG